MKTRQKTGGSRNAYFRLIQRFPLRPIRTEEELDYAIELIDELIDRDDLDEGEKDYLDVLSDLTERYELEQYPIEAVSDAAILAHLIEAKGIAQAKLAREAKIAESTISEVLNGKRRLTRSQIGRLVGCFGVGPAAFHFAS